MMNSSTTQKLSNKDRYCIEVCKAKCCFTSAGKRCPNLTAENKCGIYKLWKDNWCNYKTEEIWTVPIMYAIKNKLLPQDIAAQCCYAHPELLKKLD